MNKDSKIRHRIKEKIVRFSKEFTEGEGQRVKKFTQQVLYGMVTGKSVLLTEITRSLNEKITFKKTHDRLSRNINKEDISEALDAKVLKHLSNKVKKDTIIAIDPSEISKSYAVKMENLCKVRDGSSPKEKEIKNGYHTIEVVGINREAKEKFPILTKIYSSTTEDFKSENEEIKKVIRTLEARYGERGIYTVDRGGDRGQILKEMLKRTKRRFVIRMVGTRDIEIKAGKKKTKKNLLNVSQSCKCRINKKIYSKRDKRVCNLRIGSKKIYLPFINRELTLVVVKGFGKKPMMLLTTEEVRYREGIWDIVNIYLSRWGIEEIIRFKKQGFDLENIRLLNYVGIKNMISLVNLATQFLCKISSDCLSLKEYIIGIPKWHENNDKLKMVLYRILEGIHLLMGIYKGTVTTNSKRSNSDRQLELFDYNPMAGVFI